MALDVTPGGTASDSYLSLADSLSFATADLGLYATAWAASTDAVRERALRRATRDIDRYVGVTGYRYNDNQALAFPRLEDGAVIPTAVEQATYQQAIYVLSNADVIDEAATRRARGLSSFTEQNVSGTLAEGPLFGRLAPEAERLLTGEGFEGGAVVGWIIPD